MKTVAEELAKHKLRVVVLEEKVGSKPADNFTHVYGNGNANHHIGAGVFVHKRIRSTVKRTVIR
jgi:hypothetical protein